MAPSKLDHPTLPLIKAKFPDWRLFATEFRDQATVFVAADQLYELLAFLKNDPACDYNFLSNVIAVDYLKYPKANNQPPQAKGRFGVVYNLCSYRHKTRLFVKTTLDPTLDTKGIEDDPALHLPSSCDLWPGAEWMEREVFDMFGIRFEGHPDLRRILTWESYPAHPLRKDYPVKGRGEREMFRVIDRDSA